MSRKSEQEWNDLIVEAARSGLSVNQFCQERGLSKNQFYRKAARYGYTAGGKRTEKWEVAARGEEVPETAPQTFVAVPAETLEKALSEPEAPCTGQEIRKITERSGKFIVIVSEGFSEEALRRVLGVVANA